MLGVIFLISFTPDQINSYEYYIREGYGVIFCPPLVSVYDDDVQSDDFKSFGKDYNDYVKGDFDFIEADNKNRYNDDDKISNDSYEKHEKNEK